MPSPEVLTLLDAATTTRNEAAASASAAATSATTAGTARDEAVVAKNAAQAVGTTTDGVMTGVDGNAASTFRVQSDARLSATFGAKVGVNIKDFATLKAAIAALPSTGGTVVIPEGRFPSGDWTYDTNYMSKPNVHLVGEAMPYLSDTADRLVGGSIIYGRFNAFAHGFSVSNVGFDMGKYVIDTFYGAATTATANHPLGGTWDAFAFAQPNMTTPIAPRSGLSINNVIGLLRDSQTVGHAVLMEGARGGDGDNIIGVGGVHAVVIKSEHMRIGRLAGWSASNENIILKADTYAPCGNITIKSAESLTVPPNTTPWFTPAVAGFGLLLNPASASFTGPVQIGTYKAFGPQRGFVITGGATHAATDIQVGSIMVDTFTGNTVVGIDFWGTRAMRVQVGRLIVNGATQGVSWAPANAADNNEHQLHINTAQISNMRSRAISATLNARVRIDTLQVTSSPNAYYCDDSARILIGSERLINVTTKWERNAPALTTGWGNFGNGASTWDVKLENYGVVLKGLLGTSTGATGIFATLPAYLRPTESKRLPSTITKSSVPQFAQVGISTTGNADLNNNAAPSVGDYLSVDGIGWQHW